MGLSGSLTFSDQEQNLSIRREKGLGIWKAYVDSTAHTFNTPHILKTIKTTLVAFMPPTSDSP